MSQQKSRSLPGLAGSPVVSAGIFVDDVDEYKKDFGSTSDYEVVLEPSAVTELWTRLVVADGDLESLPEEDAYRSYAIVIAWMRLVNDRVQAQANDEPFRCIAAVKPNRDDSKWRHCTQRYPAKPKPQRCFAPHTTVFGARVTHLCD